MGQETSTLVDDSVAPQSLKSRTLDAVATYIKNGKAKRIVVLTGAGISTSAGIPDFRSPVSGLYANLAKLDLPYPEAVFDISFFRQNPLPFYSLARELYPGKFQPTISHHFIRLLYDKGLLLKLFTQNIDCLERAAGVPDSKIIEAHGSFARQQCIECKHPYPGAEMLEAVSEGRVPRCTKCNGLVKPNIVFFGEQLPEEFHRNKMLPGDADLCLIMGTSLTVQPFASLPGFCSEGVPRVLINLDRVGGLGSRADDVLVLGDCDKGIRKLASALGWSDELQVLWDSSRGVTGGTGADEEAAETSTNKTLEDEIAELSKDVDSALKISNEHTDELRAHLAKPQARLHEDGGLNDPKKIPNMTTPMSAIEISLPPASKAQASASAPAYSKLAIEATKEVHVKHDPEQSHPSDGPND